MFKRIKKPLYWVIWHPHQRLWNQTLVEIIRKLIPIRALSAFIISCIVKLDTYLLAISLKINSKNINHRGYSPQKRINYFDLGTHKFANELNWVNENVFSELPNPKNIFAFEANPKSFEIARNNVGSIEHLKFFNVALINDKPESEYIRLFLSESGLGDSIYRTRSESFVEVRATRLSELINENNIQLSDSINILRMNIEGCELDVIEDLKQHDLLKFFDGFYGMWDDASKIDYGKDIKLRKLMKEVNISPYPFNGRDMKYNSRMRLIKKSLNYSIFGKNE